MKWQLVKCPMKIRGLIKSNFKHWDQNSIAKVGDGFTHQKMNRFWIWTRQSIAFFPKIVLKLSKQVIHGLKRKIEKLEIWDWGIHAYIWAYKGIHLTFVHTKGHPYIHLGIFSTSFGFFFYIVWHPFYIVWHPFYILFTSFDILATLFFTFFTIHFIFLLALDVFWTWSMQILVLRRPSFVYKEISTFLIDSRCQK